MRWIFTKEGYNTCGEIRTQNVIDNSTETHLQVAEKVIAMPLRLPTFSGGTELLIKMDMAAKQLRQQILVRPM